MGFLKQPNNRAEIQRKKEEIVSRIKDWNTRCAEFFEWFKEEEDTFQKFISQGERQEANAHLIEGLEKILPGIDGRISIGKLMFQAKEREEAFYLLPSLNSCMPETLKERWSILPHGKSPDSEMTFIREDKKEWRADLTKTLAAIKPAKETELLPLKLSVYLPDLPQMSGEEKRDAAWHMGRAAAGEMGMFWCISECFMEEKETADMFPIEELELRLKETIRKMYGEPRFPEIFENRTYYKHEPDRRRQLPRLDIFEGYTACSKLAEEYFEKREETFVEFLKYGVIPMYLYVPMQQMNEEIHRQLEEELKEALDGDEKQKSVGVYLGFSLGEKQVYYDFLAFDRMSCLEKIDRIRQGYEFDFALSEFRETLKKMVSRKEKR